MILRATPLIKIIYWAWERLLKNFNIFIETENGFFYSSVPFIHFLWGFLMIMNAIPVVWSNFQTWGNIVEKSQHLQFQNFRFRNWRVSSCDVRTQSWVHCPNFMEIERVYDMRRQCWRSLTVRQSFFGCNPPLSHTGLVRNHFSDLAGHCAWFQK